MKILYNFLFTPKISYCHLVTLIFAAIALKDGYLYLFLSISTIGATIEILIINIYRKLNPYD
jgi:hypothetical protein